DRFRRKHGRLRRFHANRSDNAGFLKPAPHLESLHVVVSFGARLSTLVAVVTDPTFPNLIFRTPATGTKLLLRRSGGIPEGPECSVKMSLFQPPGGSLAPGNY